MQIEYIVITLESTLKYKLNRTFMSYEKMIAINQLDLSALSTVFFLYAVQHLTNKAICYNLHVL